MTSQKSDQSKTRKSGDVIGRLICQRIIGIATLGAICQRIPLLILDTWMLLLGCHGNKSLRCHQNFQLQESVGYRGGGTYIVPLLACYDIHILVLLKDTRQLVVSLYLDCYRVHMSMTFKQAMGWDIINFATFNRTISFATALRRIEL